VIFGVPTSENNFEDTPGTCAVISLLPIFIHINETRQ
jgi:hypothetical protein